MSNYYLYRWVREDKNEPFYIGIGTYQNNGGYKRAKEIGQRSNLFKKILNKSKCYYEIILESDNREFIKEKEVEFIKLYGRKDINTGSLVNHTDGGEGGEEKKIYLYDAQGNYLKEFKSCTICANYINANKKNISTNIKKGYKTKGYFLSYNKMDKLDITKHKERNSDKKRKVYQYTLNGKFLKEWSSVAEIAKHLQVNHSTVCQSIKENYRCRNYMLYYKK